MAAAGKGGPPPSGKHAYNATAFLAAIRPVDSSVRGPFVFLRTDNVPHFLIALPHCAERVTCEGVRHMPKRYAVF